MASRLGQVYRSPIPLDLRIHCRFSKPWRKIHAGALHRKKMKCEMKQQQRCESAFKERRNKEARRGRISSEKTRQYICFLKYTAEGWMKLIRHAHWRQKRKGKRERERERESTESFDTYLCAKLCALPLNGQSKYQPFLKLLRQALDDGCEFKSEKIKVRSSILFFFLPGGCPTHNPSNT